MDYSFARRLDMSFDAAIARATEVLAEHGFGVLTTIDVQQTLKKKIGAEFRPYTILGACNPKLAHRALQAESQIGLMLPCNVIVQEVDGGVEVAAVDPMASMAAIENSGLAEISGEVQGKLRDVIAAL